MMCPNVTHSITRKLNRIIACLFILIFAACSDNNVRPSELNVETYQYKPSSSSEKPALVRGSPVYSKLVRMAAGSAYITHIDGRRVEEVDDGGLQWMAVGSQMKGIAYPVSPGAHILTASLKAGSTVQFEIMFKAKAEGRYTLIAINESLGGPACVHTWLEDAKHNPITKDQIFGCAQK